MNIVHRAHHRLTIVTLILAATCLAFFAGVARPADDVKVAPRRVVVHVYPEPIQPRDLLLDGPNGKRIDVGAPATLIWVDLMPDARYAHDTEYVLITGRGTRVVKGQWWPNLNGKDILRGQAAERVRVPIEVGE